MNTLHRREERKVEEKGGGGSGRSMRKSWGSTHKNPIFFSPEKSGGLIHCPRLPRCGLDSHWNWAASAPLWASLRFSIRAPSPQPLKAPPLGNWTPASCSSNYVLVTWPHQPPMLGRFQRATLGCRVSPEMLWWFWINVTSSERSCLTTWDKQSPPTALTLHTFAASGNANSGWAAVPGLGSKVPGGRLSSRCIREGAVPSQRQARLPGRQDAISSLCTTALQKLRHRYAITGTSCALLWLKDPLVFKHLSFKHGLGQV